MFDKGLSLVPEGATFINPDPNDHQFMARMAGAFVAAPRTADAEKTDAELRAERKAAGNQNTRFVWPEPGSRVVNGTALNNKRYKRWPKMRPTGNAGMLLELRCSCADEATAKATRAALCKVFSSMPGDGVSGLYSHFVCDAWWAGAGKHDQGLGILAGSSECVACLKPRCFPSV